MLVRKPPQAGATNRLEARVDRKAFGRHVFIAQSRSISHTPTGTCGRVLTVAVFAKKDHKDQKHADEIAPFFSGTAELQAYIDRERFLLSELAATRGQVDKLLEQQRVLLDMIARLSGLSAASGHQPLAISGGSSSYPAAATSPPSTSPSPPQLIQSPPPPPPASPSSSLSPSLPSPSSSRASSSVSSTSSNIPALNSLADLFKSAAAAATHPASAAAAASIAAAIAAVDGGDIMSISKFDTQPAEPAPPPATQAAPVPLPQPPMLFDTMGGVTAVASSVSYSAGTGSEDSKSATEAAEVPVEVAKAAPTDPPPDLVQGDDDIFWLSRLHSALEERGFFPGDDDMENWFFGEGTLAAVLAFQASERIPEIGVVDRTTWTALLGPEVAEELYSRTPTMTTTAPALVTSTATATASLGAATATSSSSRLSAASGSAAATAGVPPEDLTKWPVLMDGDGGREVHALQVALSNSGFHCGDDDMRWWQFGDSTLTALKYFQSCNSLPESGVCDERSWRRLLGPEAAPKDLYSVRMAVVNSDDEDGGFEDDMDGVS
ncbi:hypothetical protein Vafri_19872, partial [Volvox africanus]